MHVGECHRKWHHLIGKILGLRHTKIGMRIVVTAGRFVPESGTTKRTHLAPLYHSDTLTKPHTYIDS